MTRKIVESVPMQTLFIVLEEEGEKRTLMRTWVPDANDEAVARGAVPATVWLEGDASGYRQLHVAEHVPLEKGLMLEMAEFALKKLVMQKQEMANLEDEEAILLKGLLDKLILREQAREDGRKEAQ